MKWLFSQVTEKFKYWFFCIAIILGDTCKVLIAYLLGTFINVIQYGDKSTLISLTIITISISIIATSMAYFGVIQVEKVSVNTEKELKKRCYSKLNKFGQQYYHKESLGELTSILTSDMATIKMTLAYIIKTLGAIIISFIIAFIICLTINVPLTFLILFPMPIVFIISKRHIKRTNPLYEERRELNSKFNNFVQENIEGNRVVKSFGCEKKEIKNCQNLNNLLKSKTLEHFVRFRNYYSKVSFFSGIMTVLLLLFGGIFIIEGKISLGDLIIISSLTWMLQSPFTELSSLLDMFQECKVAVSRIRKVLETKEEIIDNGKEILKDINETIIFKDVTVAFEDIKALKNINITINSGQTIAFIGEVGSGKSTISKLLLRFIEPTKGEIFINNKNIKNYTLNSLRDKIGYVSQTPFLFSDTILNNLKYGKESLSKEESHKYLALASSNFVLKLKDGVDTIIGENGVSLSGGEKQCLSLARALTEEPNLLILDDITSALDFETELEITKNINDLKYKCTKIIIASKILSVKDADQIFVLKNGMIIEHGKHNDLLNNKKYYYELYKIQEGKEVD